jgi:hypothetical protein
VVIRSIDDYDGTLAARLHTKLGPKLVEIEFGRRVPILYQNCATFDHSEEVGVDEKVSNRSRVDVEPDRFCWLLILSAPASQEGLRLAA